MIRALLRELACQLTGHDYLPVIDTLHRCNHCHRFTHKDTSTS